MVDLLNALSEKTDGNIFVFHSRQKSWDSSHDYQMIPSQKYPHDICRGKTVFDQFRSLPRLVRCLLKGKQIVLVAGYAGIPNAFSILVCFIRNIPFLVWADHFNLGKPPRYGRAAQLARDALRKIIFNKAMGVLVCGVTAMEQAHILGCPQVKLLNFPYTVCADRLLADRDMMSAIIPVICERSAGRVRILFSGRFIQRKGLDLLLTAIGTLPKEVSKPFLIIEGEGPLRSEYEELAATYHLMDSTFFTGFKQMNTHNALLAISDVVVVPSYDDPWGIVVDEAMIMGKAVVASNKVGSALDRIVHGKNGYLFESANVQELQAILMRLCKNQPLRDKVGREGRSYATIWSPIKNVERLLHFIHARFQRDCVNDVMR